VKYKPFEMLFKFWKRWRAIHQPTQFYNDTGFSQPMYKGGIVLPDTKAGSVTLVIRKKITDGGPVLDMRYKVNKDWLAGRYQ